jgi:predicted nuclease of predicted toxin-antitoxin system
LQIPATDIQIWEYAQSNESIIVTNDADFINLLNLKGFPPKIVLLKTGNQSNAYLGSILIKHKAVIESFDLDVETGLLEIF